MRPGIRVGVLAGSQASPADQVMNYFAVGFEHLLKVVADGDLENYDSAEYVAFMQAFERMRNPWP